MKRRVLSIMLVLIMCFCTFDVAASHTNKTVNLTKKVKTRKIKSRKIKKAEVKKITSSSINLLNETIKYDKDGENVLISPTSVIYAFGLLENGAKGKTKSQIEEGIFGGIKTKSANQILNYQMNSMKEDKGVNWRIANSLWVSDRKDVKVKKNYLRNIKSYYGADIFKTPFDDSSVKKINKWVKKNTKKMIPKIVDDMDDETVACLINTICFKGAWAEKFSDDLIEKDQIFNNFDGTTSKVTQMSCEVGGYFTLNGAYGFEKLYQGGKYAFVGIKMPEGKTTEDFISELTMKPAKFNKALNNIKTDKDVTITMPEFSLDYNAKLRTPIKKMGVKRVFDKDRANLYNMFKKDKKGNYYLDDVIHKTHIEVNKNGTKAAAATVLDIRKNGAMPIEKEKLNIVLDNPFIYAIVDRENGMPIFMGCVNKMKNKIY